MSGLQQTKYITEQPRADFNVEDFNRLIAQKGRRALVETSLRCPCKSRSVNQQSDCRNCGGTGFIFINPREIRMVMQGIGVITKFQDWSDEARGTVNISTPHETELAFMDRITVLDGESIYAEARSLKKRGSTYFCYLAYKVKRVSYIALFAGEDKALVRLEATDYTLTGNVLKIDVTKVDGDILADYAGDLSFTIRYVHAPTYLVVEMKRETMETFELIGDAGEKLQRMPLSAYARRLHYNMSPIDIDGVQLIDNSDGALQAGIFDDTFDETFA